MGEYFQWQANGQCSRGDSWSLNDGSNSGQRTQTDGKSLINVAIWEEKVLQD